MVFSNKLFACLHANSNQRKLLIGLVVASLEVNASLPWIDLKVILGNLKISGLT
jgi:hypothetical protein